MNKHKMKNFVINNNMMNNNNMIMNNNNMINNNMNNNINMMNNNNMIMNNNNMINNNMNNNQMMNNNNDNSKPSDDNFKKELELDNETYILKIKKIKPSRISIKCENKFDYSEK